MNQPYKFRFELENGGAIEGGAESIGLCYDHIRYCLANNCAGGEKIAKAFYLGRNGAAKPKLVLLEAK